MLGRILSVLIGYVFGMFQTGYFYGKVFENTDIRTKGSGNAGTTNVLRTFGPKAAIIVLLGDILKVVITCLLCKWLFGDSSTLRGGNNLLYMLWGGLGCTLGHNFPFYMHFKGGKGIAVLAGLVIMTNTPLTIIGLILFVGAVALTKFVTLGSILVSLMFAIGWTVLALMGKLPLYPNLLPESCILAAIIGLMAVWQHRANIKRLLAGNERKISFKKTV
ncbi:MAG: glycerol-3-phosphate 1-O-acyltransferase PlsY [Lachnospiraceae bacterium]|nr:glycerol-3-phosphate 1-O-acyltransferase PlsY [Lachnospiraceae bacterium]